jgi:hypothetical protein
MYEILNKHQEELKILYKEILLLEENIKDKAKEKSLIEYNIEHLEKENKDIKEFHQNEKDKLQNEIEEHMVDIADLGVYLDEERDELKNIKEINEELLKEKEELKNLNISKTIEN